MAEVFSMHNSMGRFFDERIYQCELASRCGCLGIEARREVEVRVTHGNYIKSYFLDLFIGRGCIYELKTVASLGPSHEKQLIHYLLLMDLAHGKLVNFRPGSVESRFVSTRLLHEDRKNFQIDARGWHCHGSRLETCLLDLLQDWGAFLDADLYREALLHQTHSPEGGIQPIPVLVDGRVVGHQKLCLLDPESAWHLSAIRDHFESYETHIRRLLNHTPLAKLHWINLNQRHITLKTLSK